MADWTELDTDGLLPGEPLTSAKALAFFENPVAMAEGKINAPKIVSEALNMFAEQTTTSPTAYTDLGRINKVLITCINTHTSGTGNSRAQYRTSTDNGATYGSYTNIPGTVVATVIPLAVGQLLVSLGASINAIEFRRDTFGATSGAIDLTILGVSGISP